MKKLTLLFSLFFSSFGGISSTQNIDSLFVKLKNSTNDINKIDLLNNISKQYYLMGATSKIEEFANEALLLSKKITYQKGLCESYLNLGLANRIYGNNQKALTYFNKALVISKEIKNKKLQADIIERIGLVYESQDKYEKALKLFFESLKIREDIKDLKGISKSYNCIGIIFSNQSNNSKALEYYHKSLKIKKQLSDKYGTAKSTIKQKNGKWRNLYQLLLITQKEIHQTLLYQMMVKNYYCMLMIYQVQEIFMNPN